MKQTKLWIAVLLGLAALVSAIGQSVPIVKTVYVTKPMRLKWDFCPEFRGHAPTWYEITYCNGTNNPANGVTVATFASSVAETSSISTLPANRSTFRTAWVKAVWMIPENGQLVRYESPDWCGGNFKFVSLVQF